jgi:putative metallohydrolase (TIGR04338 family)
MPVMAEAKAKSMSWYWRAEYAVSNWCAVYSAEEWLKPTTFGVKYKTLEEVDSWLTTVFDDSWFEGRFREACDLYGFTLHDGRGSRCATGDYKYGFCHLTLPRFARNQLIVLHELSHALAIASGNHDGHKRGFCRIYLSLVGNFLGHAASADLRLNLKTFDHDGACL